MIRKGNTRKSVDQILDEAADILEGSGWVTRQCYSSVTGGYCALGAIAQAVYPEASGGQIGDLAYVFENDANEYRLLTGRNADPRHAEAVEHLAAQVARRKSDLQYPDNAVYRYNDTGRRSAKTVVAKIRKAAEAYRAKVAA